VDALPAVARDVVAHYAAIAEASYADSRERAEALDVAVAALVASPTEQTLAAAREAWLDSREPYLQTEVYRFYEGPIDNALDGVEGLVNAWPLDEAFIDYVVGDPDAGIINDPTQPITRAELVNLNEQGGETNIATGYHAVEFLLWGQDLSESGPGARSHLDFVTGEDATAPNGERRGTYLQTVSGLLVDHLAQVEAAWADKPSTYRQQLVAGDPTVALQRMLTGMIFLAGTETGGERLQVALDTGDQEDEHSCFSDNTHRDMILDVQGIQNVWEGRYGRIDGSRIEGPGLRAVVAERDPDLAARVSLEIQAALDLANALVPPFDAEIRQANEAGRARVASLVAALRDVEASLLEVIPTLGLPAVVVE
jgi:putative iron-regulated protein